MKEKLRRIPALKGPYAAIDLATLPETPHEAFVGWLDDALAAGISEPHSMTLSTVDEDGCPDARVLILKNLDERGWHFAIKASSPKARQIDRTPQVALTFHWPVLGRQIRLRGLATRSTAAECAADFLDRPRSSRISAMASKQSEILEDPNDLARALNAAEAALSADPGYVSPDWSVFTVAPRTAEFWQGATDRNHLRLLYTRRENTTTWETARLWP